MDFFRQQRFAAFRAYHHGVERLPALAMLMQQRQTTLVDHVGIAPMHQRHHDRIEIEALLSEDVLVPFGRFLVGNATQHALPDQLLKPFGEQVARDSERGLKSLKPPCSQEAFPQDQKAPAIANHTYGAGQRTWFFLQGIPLHSCSLQSARRLESNSGNLGRSSHSKLVLNAKQSPKQPLLFE